MWIQIPFTLITNRREDIDLSRFFSATLNLGAIKL